MIKQSQHQYVHLGSKEYGYNKMGLNFALTFADWFTIAVAVLFFFYRNHQYLPPSDFVFEKPTQPPSDNAHSDAPPPTHGLLPPSPQEEDELHSHDEYTDSEDSNLGSQSSPSWRTFSFSFNFSALRSLLWNILTNRWALLLIVAGFLFLQFRFGTLFRNCLSPQQRYRDAFCELEFSTSSLVVVLVFLYFLGPYYAFCLIAIRIISSFLLTGFALILHHQTSNLAIREKAAVAQTAINNGMIHRRNRFSAPYYLEDGEQLVKR
jgi:hypothetical protein